MKWKNGDNAEAKNWAETKKKHFLALMQIDGN